MKTTKMKFTLLSLLVLAIFSLSMACAKNQKSTKKADTLPREGYLITIEQGDLACYLTLKAPDNRVHNLLGNFEICQDKYSSKRVRLKYTKASINDCESAEPCGKTRQVDLVNHIEVLK